MRKHSCWTCRIRHKKCDGSTPICRGCATLEIDCHYSTVKPDWMDNGDGQQRMAEQIKAQVRQSAKRRRGIALMESIVKDLSNVPADQQIASRLDDNASSLSRRESCLTAYPSQGPGRRPDTRSNPAKDQPDVSPHAPSESTRQDEPLDTLTSGTELGMGFITGYMDYVFPSLYPFYKPSILEGGRTWVLVLATNNPGFFCSIVSLSAYFFSIVPVIPGPGHETCAATTWKELQTQVASALLTVQHDLMTLGRRGVSSSLLESVTLMGNIVQYLGFEVAIRSGKWKMHLEAATNLFQQILEAHGDENGRRGIQRVLNKLCRGGSNPSYDVPSPYQGAFKFFSSVLLIKDIIASTSLGRPPKLTMFHCELEPNGGPPTLTTEAILGCQSWVFLILSDIAALDAWRKDEADVDELITADLSSRAASIESRIQACLTELDELESTRASKPRQHFEAFLQHTRCACDMHSFNEGCADVTRIWALAAHTYLRVVWGGWNMSDPQIRKNTMESIKIFRKMISPFWLRSLVWPFCVSGCVASQEEKAAFRAIGSSLHALQAFGTAREALSVLDTVWSKNDDINESAWDIGQCLRSLGYAVLLV
ncbi:fungal-specific transcription factor domain-containing protein [Thelonectria olida]|uniref:Fungal-specific transcription factor domain-containing protein n=1 Tax=Thelonectria olida TaxID=1576542 RepID=A0A9P8W243_9HYPO|nr:fungal-specific transcription factor domain-containing protein [Thelonectria olida]